MATRGNILARIPADNGKRIRYGHGQVMVVGPEACEICGESEATAVLQGETDSFGFEPMLVCESCNADCTKQEDEHLNALDIVDGPPPEGHVFMVSEGTNYDGHGDWTSFHTSRRAAMAKYRRIEILAEPWCGLYPNKGVREVTVEERDRIRASIRKQREAELQEHLE